MNFAAISKTSLLHVLVFICLVQTNQRGAGAQSVSDSGDAQTKLSQPVTLDMSSKSIKQVLENVSRQVHLPVEAEEYLQDRIVTLKIKSMPARLVLDELSDLCGAKWELKGSGTCLMYRPKRPRPHSLTESAGASFNALPPEYRRFLTSGPVVPKTMKRPNVPYDDSLAEMRRVFYQVDLKLSESAQQETAKIVGDLSAAILKGEAQFSKLAPSAQQRVVFLMTLQAITTTTRLMRGDLPDFYINPSSATLYYQTSDGSLSVRGSKGSVMSLSPSPRLR